MGILRIVLAFLCGIVVYWIGFFVGGMIGELIAGFTVMPQQAVLSEFWAGGAALAANAGGFAVFLGICKRGKRKKAAAYIFVTILAVFAVAYAVLCFLSQQDYLLAYPAACIIPIILFYIMVKRGEYEEVKDGQIHSDVS